MVFHSPSLTAECRIVRGQGSNLMQIQIQLTLKDYLQAYRAHMGPGYFFFPVAGVLAMILGIFYSWVKLPATYAIVSIPIGALVAVFFPIALRRHFKSNKKLSRPFSVTFSGDGIETVSEYGDSRIKWSAFLHFVENNKVFLLYSQPNYFLVFPKRFFSPELLNEFGQLVHSNLTPKKRARNIIRTVLVWVVLIIAIVVLYQVIKSSGR